MFVNVELGRQAYPDLNVSMHELFPLYELSKHPEYILKATAIIKNGNDL
jgi:hypothetical protein